ncbi:MAG: hypothetical protein LBU04_07320 [Christensenellaceae bacterium]|nr:hypothetical protein [Christensenellaceae bacterium]
MSTQLKCEPLCSACLKAGSVTHAEIADYIQPICEDGARLDIENQQYLSALATTASMDKKEVRHQSEASPRRN